MKVFFKQLEQDDASSTTSSRANFPVAPFIGPIRWTGLSAQHDSDATHAGNANVALQRITGGFSR